MSASLLSGGPAPASVPLSPGVAGVCLANDGVTPVLFTNTGSGVSSLVVQQSSSCQQPVINPGAGQTQALGNSVSSSSLAIIQPPFATNFSTGAPVAEGQSQFVFICPNATAAGGGAPGGALSLYSYVNGLTNNQLLLAPKPNTTPGTGDDILQLMGGSQSGTVTITAPATASAAIPNTLILAGTPVFVQNLGALDATATAFRATITPNTSFVITANAAPTAPVTLAWFIPRY